MNVVIPVPNEFAVTAVNAHRVVLIRVDRHESCASVYVSGLVCPKVVHVCELHLHVVAHLIAHWTIDEDIQVKVLVAESIIETECKFRQWRTDIGAVFLIDNAVTIDVLVLDVAYIDGRTLGKHTIVRIRWRLCWCLDVGKRCIDSIAYIAIEIEERFAYIGKRHYVCPLTIAYEWLSVAARTKRDELVLIEGNLEFWIPLEISTEWMYSESDFKTCIADCTIVSVRCIELWGIISLCTHIWRQLELHEHILWLFAIEIHYESDAIIEESEIETYVDLLLWLPLHCCISYLCWTIWLTEVWFHYWEWWTPLVASDVWVTCLTPTETDFTIGKPFAHYIRDKLLTAEAPRSSCWMEACPAIVGSKVWGTVTTVSISKVIEWVVTIVQTSEEWRHGWWTETVADGWCTITEGWIVYDVGWKLGIENRTILIVWLPALLTEHCCNGMLVESLIVSDVVLELPELVCIVLDTAWVGSTLPSSEWNHWFIGLTLWCAEVETELCMPSKILERLYLKEYITIELLTIEENIVIHSHSDRVRRGETFLWYGWIVTVDVVDLNVWRCSQRVCDKTRLWVCKLQVIVSIGICYWKTELQPVLQLCVEIGTERETIKVWTDNGTFLIHIRTRNIILHLISTTLCAYLMWVLDSGLENGILPVCALTKEWRVREFGWDSALAYSIVIIGILCILTEIEQIHTLCLTIDSHHSIIRELSLACLTTLSSDKHYAVCTLCTIDSCSGSILQYLHAYDVCRVDSGKWWDSGVTSIAESIAKTVVSAWCSLTLHDDTVDYVERFCICIDSGSTTYTDSRTWTRRTRSLHSGDTGCTSLKWLVEGRDDRAFESTLTYWNRWTRDITLLHSTITYDYHFLKGSGIAFQCYIYIVATSQLNFLCLIAYIRDSQSSVSVLHLDNKLTIEVCSRTVLSTLFTYCCADSWFALIIYDGTGHCNLCHNRCREEHKQRE